MPSAVVVHDLEVRHGLTPLVRGVSFEIADGERVALLGASGSGKSLTAAAILGALPPGFTRSGEISVFGQSVSQGRAPRGVAAVFQDSAMALNPLVSVGHQLVAVLRAHQSISGHEASRAVLDVLESVGIDDPERAMRGYAPELSGGQRQRVCISLALLCGARVLIADEPTTALDVVTQAQVLRVLRQYGDVTGAAVLFITHDLAVASSLCTRALVLEDGVLIESGPMSAIVSAPQHPFTQSLVAAAAPAVSGVRA